MVRLRILRGSSSCIVEVYTHILVGFSLVRWNIQDNQFILRMFIFICQFGGFSHWLFGLVWGAGLWWHSIPWHGLWEKKATYFTAPRKERQEASRVLKSPLRRPNFLSLYIHFLFFFFLKSLTLQSWLAWKLICRSGWLTVWTTRPTS